MGHFENSVVFLQKLVSNLGSDLSENEWSGFERNRFIVAGEKTVKGIGSVVAGLTNAEHFAELSASETASEFREKKIELLKLSDRLKRNVEMESNRSGDSAELFPEKRLFNANFSGLQHETQTLLLQVAYLSEKALLDARRRELSPLQEPSTAKTLLHLLREKESELQETKSRQFALQKQALLGVSSEPSLMDLEADLSSSFGRIQLGQQRVEQQFSRHQELSEKMLDSTLSLRNEVSGLQESISALSEKHQDLLLRLKKETEYARELALRIEHETVGLRGKYTTQILDLNQQVLKAREEEAQKFEKRLASLEKENHKQHELVDHFKTVVEGKEKTIRRLEDYNVHLRLVLATHVKHKAAKDAFLPENQNNKKKKNAN